MKRTTPDPAASNRSGNNPPPANEEVEDRAPDEGHWYNPKMKEKGGKIKPLTAEEMEARLFLTLASTSEIENKEIHIKIGKPDPFNSAFPLDVMNKIASFIPSGKAQRNFASTDRWNYLRFDEEHPLRRFPGLVGDLKRTCKSNLNARLDLMKRFDEHIKSGGGYESVLLTPLSPLSRLSTAIAMMEWAENQTIKADKPACIKLAQERLLTEFTSLKTNSAIKPDELRDMLMMAVRAVLTAPAGKINTQRSLAFTMVAGKQIMNVLKGDLLDDTTQWKIIFEVLKANADSKKNEHYLQFETSQWSLEHLAVAMLCKPNTLLSYRLRELSPTERPAAVKKIIQTALTQQYIESHSYSARNILILSAVCLATLNNELKNETESIINLFIDLCHHIAKEQPPGSKRQSSDYIAPSRIDSIPEYAGDKIAYKNGFEYDNPQEAYINNLKLNELHNQSFYFLKGYVYRRMFDWINLMPDPEIAAKILSALRTSLFGSTPSTTY